MAATPGLPPGVRALFPAPGARGACVDPGLRIEFWRAAGEPAPSVGDAGVIAVYDSASSEVMARIDLAATTFTRRVGGLDLNVERPVYVDGDAVVIVLPRRLEHGHEYSVTIEDNAIHAPSGQALAVEAASGWRFTTRAAPAANLAALRVAADGTGDVCSLQAALDLISEPAAGPSTIGVAPGVYHELLRLRDRNDVTIEGDERQTTVVSATNNERLNPGTERRALVAFEHVRGLTLRAMTFQNSTPQDGTQAEALRLQDCQRCVVRDMILRSLQDTVEWSGSIYARDCLIEGNVDFVWGDGSAYFDRCELKTVGRAGAIVAARNPASAYGFVFVDSRLTSEPGISGQLLARVDASVYPASNVAFIDCELGPHLAPEGFRVSGGDGSALRFWEYSSVDPSGRLVDTSHRLPAARQLSQQEAESLRDVSVVLDGFAPKQ